MDAETIVRLCRIREEFEESAGVGWPIDNTRELLLLADVCAALAPQDGPGLAVQVLGEAGWRYVCALVGDGVFVPVRP